MSTLKRKLNSKGKILNTTTNVAIFNIILIFFIILHKPNTVSVDMLSQVKLLEAF